MRLSKLLRALQPAPLIGAAASQLHKRRFGWYTANVRMAFLTLQFVAEPKIGHAIEQHFEEHDEDDEESSGEPIDPLAHILRQAKKLQQGIPIDRLTARLPPLP